MKRIVALLLLPLSLGQAPAPGTQPSPSDIVIRISVNLVQVDAVVTDAKNHPVTDLKADDFEILQDGKPQKITNFSYVNAAEPAVKTASNKSTPAPPVPGPPPALKPNQVRRVVALVVDDLGLSFESTAYVHEALKKFVDQQMQPGDLVAIVRTGAGIGALQQFTTDKRLLYAAIDRVRFNAFGRVGVSSFTPLASGQRLDNRLGSVRGTESDEAQARFSQSLEDIYSVGSLGAIRYVVEGLRDMPGRKVLLLFSENMRLVSHEGVNSLVMENLRRLTDAAERSSVVIYTIDPRGLPTLGLSAADDTSGMSAAELTQAPLQRSNDYFDSQEGLAYLARETGGLFIHDTNDIVGGIRQVMNDVSGYYLIGYHPAPGTFDPNTGERKFHSVSVRIKRPGLHVRSRNGFFGFENREHMVTAATRESEIAHALASPFTSPDIHLRLTSLFANWEKGSYVTDLLHADARDLSFTDEPDGSHKAVVDVVAITFGDNGQAVDSSDRTYHIRVKPEHYQEVLQNGFIFTLQHLVKKPGAYQMRTALRDVASKKLGTASQFIEVPDVKKGHLALSSIMLTSTSANPEEASTLPTEREALAADPTGNPAVRIFKPGMTLTYEYEVLNARTEKTSPPQLTAQLRLFRDGKQLYTGQPIAIDVASQQDPKRLPAGGLVQLGAKFPPGDYVLQVVVNDNLATKEKFRTASQWMDFEVQGEK